MDAENLLLWSLSDAQLIEALRRVSMPLVMELERRGIAVDIARSPDARPELRTERAGRTQPLRPAAR